MEKLKKVVKALMFPPLTLHVILIILGFLSLIPAFGALVGTFFPYFAYLFSTYALALLVTFFFRGRFKMRGRVHFPRLKLSLSLLLSASVNILFFITKLIEACMRRSLWVELYGICQIGFAASRIYLFRNHDKKEGAFLLSRSASFLLLLEFPLVALIIKTIQEGEAWNYPGFLIYAYAFYAFFSLSRAIYNLVKWSKRNELTYLSARLMNFAQALLSIFCLQSALLSRFSAEAEDFRNARANAATGCAIVIIIALLSLFMFHESSSWRKTHS